MSWPEAVIWSDEMKAKVHPGRGVGAAPDGGKAPTLAKLRRDVRKSAARHPDYWKDTQVEDARLAEAMAQAIAFVEGDDAPLSALASGVLFHHVVHRDWQESSKASQAPLMVRLWCAQGSPAEAVEALVAAWATEHFEARGRGKEATPARLAWTQMVRDPFLNFKRDGDRIALAFQAMRAHLATVSAQEYAEVVKVVEAARQGAPLVCRCWLDFLVPTEGAWTLADALEMEAQESRSDVIELLGSGVADPAEAVRLFVECHEACRERWLMGMLARHGAGVVVPLIDALPKLRAITQWKPEWMVIEALVRVPTPEVAAAMAEVLALGDRWEVERLGNFFFDHAKISVPALRAVASAGGDGGARAAEALDAILRAHPELGPDADAVADESSLPAPLRSDVPMEPLDPAVWDPALLPPLHLADGAVLPLSAVERLAALLRRVDGTLTKNVQLCVGALAPESREAMAEALWAMWSGPEGSARWRCRRVEHKWMAHAQGLIGGDATAARIGGEARRWAGTWFSQGRSVIAALVTIGSDAALLQLQDIAQRGKSNGLRRAAEGALSQVARARGVSAEALMASLVPKLGLERPEGWVFDYGPRTFALSLDRALVPSAAGPDGKARKSLPRPVAADDGVLAADAQVRWKELKKGLAQVAPGLLLTLEDAMVEGRVWARADWEARAAGHPLVASLLRRLVMVDDVGRSFTLDEGGAAVDEAGGAVAVGQEIRLLHPAQATPELLALWRAVIPELEQPFEQLWRATFAPGDAATEAVVGRLTGGVVSPRGVRGLIQAGWRRGVVEDNGLFWSVARGAGGATATLALREGLSVDRASSDPAELGVTLTLDAGQPGVGFSELLRQLDRLR